MPDPLRSALHAAALATMTASEREHSETCHDGGPGPGHIRRAAETVAAFLRALPDVIKSVPFSSNSDGLMHTRQPYLAGALAAAVERAARDE